MAIKGNLVALLYVNAFTVGVLPFFLEPPYLHYIFFQVLVFDSCHIGGYSQLRGPLMHSHVSTVRKGGYYLAITSFSI